jgi:hypothetical protein
MPIGYMPPAYVQPPVGGMYMQRAGLRRSFGQAIGWIEPPRNVSAYEYQMNAAQAFGEKMGAGTAAAGISGAGLAVGAAAAPIGAAIGGAIGAGIGTFIAGPLGTVAGGAVGSFVGGAATSLLGLGVAGKVTDLMSQQREVRNYLETSSFRFVGAGSEMADPRMGRGMGTRARREVAEYMTQLDVKDRFMDLGDLSRVLQAGTEQGVFTGTQNMDDFKKKFKTLTDNVKEIAKAFNTSLEDAVKVVRDMRSMGMDAGQARQVVTQAESLGKVAGRTAAEMFAVGQQGAEMYRGTGVSMQIGFQAAQANLAAIRSARDAGLLSQEAIAQAGGEEALAQRQVAGALGARQTAFGRGVMMSMVQGGQLDVSAMNRFITGEAGSLSDIAMRAAGNVSSPAELLRFQARQPKIMSEFGKRMGGEAMQLAEMSQLVVTAEFMKSNVPGLSMDDAFRASAQRAGKSEPEIEAMMARMKNREKEFQSRQVSAETTRIKQAADAAQSNFVLTRAWEGVKDVGTSLANVVTQPVNRMIDSFSEKAKSFVERNIYGFERVDIGKTGYQTGMEAELLEKSIDMSKYSNKQATFNRGRLLNLDAGKGAAATVGGEGIAGEISEEGYRGHNKGAVTNVLGIRTTTDKKQMGVILDEQFFGMRDVGLRVADVEKLEQFGRVYNINEEETKRMRDSKSFETLRQEKLGKLTDIVGGKKMGVSQLSKHLFGKEPQELNKEEMLVFKETLGTTGFETQAKDLETTGRAAQNLTMEIDAAQMKDVEAKYNETRAKAAEMLDVDAEDLSDAAFSLVQQAATEKDLDKRNQFISQAAIEIGKTTGEDLGEITKKIKKTTSDRDMVGNLTRVKEETRAYQIARGASQQKEHLETLANTTAKESERQALLSASKKLGSGAEITTMTSEEIQAISSTDKTGRLGVLATTLKSVKDSVEVVDGKQTINTERLKKTLDESKIPLNEMQKATLISRATKEGDVRGITESLYQTQIAAKDTQALSGAAAPGAGQNMGTGTAQDQFITQTSINQTVLAVLEALARKMEAAK